MRPFAWLAVALAPALGLAQQHEETIQRSFPVPASAGASKLLVDNITGYIHVTGDNGHEVRVTARKRISADSDAALAQAGRDVKLDMSQQGNSVRLYVDGPFRGHDGKNPREYRVAFDYDIQVPFATELNLKTLNGVGIEVKKTTGDFEIHSLNAGIDLEEVSGSGSVRTLNGPLKAVFSQNPAKATDFQTLNGKIDVYFHAPPDADLNFHTLNGDVYTDFDVAARPTETSGENRNGKWVYRSNRRNMEGRAGKGGPALTFHTLNGSIRLHSKGITQ